MSAAGEIIFRYNPFTRLPMVVGGALIGGLGCFICIVQILSEPNHRRMVVLAVAVVAFALIFAACWALWAANLFGGPAARITPDSAELRGFGARVVVDRQAPGLAFEWLRSGVLVTPASAATILKRGLLRARALPDGAAWVPLEHRAVWKGGALVDILNGGGRDL